MTTVTHTQKWFCADTPFLSLPRTPIDTLLSAKTIEIVKATAPVMAEHGYAITSAMYGSMLTSDPYVSPRSPIPPSWLVHPSS